MVTMIILLPFLASIISGLFSKSDRFSQIITSFATFLSFILSCIAFKQVVIDKEILSEIIFNWISIPGFKVDWTVTIDSLSAVMLLVVTSVSTLVHIYSIGYMKDDPHKKRFMSYLSLFTFAMLMLVTSNNLLQLFFGWEGVGLCSYLLIGFWYEKNSAYKAAMKAFIVNRIADFAFIIGIATIYFIFSSTDFSIIFSNISTIALSKNIQIFGYIINPLDFICIMLFLGAMGKSAQLGLHVWLPDAMEGPTPVSALIHAATMVTAGIFLIVKFSPLFEYSEIARNMILIVGISTAFFGSFVAITQKDIKKIIAYSTCSQLGYMFAACGVSAYAAAIFHLATHAFFKALLFLSAGSVIHSLHGEQDIFKMGGKLWKKIPITYSLFWIGSLAIAGFPPLSGYYSKDVIIESLYMTNSKLAYASFIISIVVAFFTAFYSWRIIFKVFHGKRNYPIELDTKIHESPKSMLIPMILLSIGSIFAGYIGYKLGMVDDSLDFWNYSIYAIEENNILGYIVNTPAEIKYLPLFVSLVAILLAYVIYVVNPKFETMLKKYLKIFYNISYNKFYFDEIYHYVLVKPLEKLSSLLWKFFDIQIIDNMGPNGATKLTKYFSKTMSKLQTGYIYHYVFMMFFGLLLIITFYII